MNGQADSSDASVIAYSREMGLTHADFWRLLPKAMGLHSYTLSGNTVQATVDTGTLEITLGPPEERRIALLRLPYSVVAFRFVGVDEVQQLAFKAHFDLYFQRGGG